MEIYSTEDQQVDAIKQFFKSYGRSIIIGLVVGLGGFYGWNYYSDYKVRQTEAASATFQQLSNSVQANSLKPAAVADFNKAYQSQKGYQALFDLIVAKTAVKEGNLAKAEQSLKQVIATDADDGLVTIATLRLARVQAEQGQFATAITTLKQITATPFIAQRDELKGDFLLRQGKLDKAKQAYQEAINKGGINMGSSLQMKLDNLNKE